MLWVVEAQRFVNSEARFLLLVSWLGSKDSNLNFRIQSAMFYH